MFVSAVLVLAGLELAALTLLATVSVLSVLSVLSGLAARVFSLTLSIGLLVRLVFFIVLSHPLCVRLILRLGCGVSAFSVVCVLVISGLSVIFRNGIDA
jgi:hypothetical protein